MQIETGYGIYLLNQDTGALLNLCGVTQEKPDPKKEAFFNAASKYGVKYVTDPREIKFIKNDDKTVYVLGEKVPLENVVEFFEAELTKKALEKIKSLKLSNLEMKALGLKV